jgi:predicted metal-dependent HD superfamily phosphohydrolase
VSVPTPILIAFARNTADIRAEYACFADDEFAAGQRGAFERFLQKERIFRTEWGAKLEAAARRNLERGLRG